MAELEASNLVELEMISAILAGETHLYHDLIRPHERSVYQIALSYMRNESDAEDVAQEAFVRAFRNLASFRFEAKFGTWLISITANEARNRLRRRSVLHIDSLDTSTEDGKAISPALLRDWREIPSEILEREEIRKLLHEAIKTLPEIYRQVFLLRDVEELNVHDTAQALNLSVANVKVRLHRARIMLQKCLAPQLRTATRISKRRWLPW